MTANNALVALFHFIFSSVKRIVGVQLYGKECQTQEDKPERMKGM